MGNTQSNEKKPNYKIYKIVGVNEEEKYTRCYLDDYVSYENGNYKYMDFEKDKVLEVLNFGATLFGTNTNPLAILSVGWYIRVDMNMMQECHSSENFSRQSLRNVMVQEGSSSSLLEATGDLGNEIFEARERYAAMIEQNQADNYARFRQTFYDMPPKK